MPFGVDDALLAASLLGGFFGKKKKNNEAKRVADANAAADLKYRQEMAAREDAINAGKTDVANQTASKNEKVRVGRSAFANSLIDLLSNNTLNKDALRAGLTGNTDYNPIHYTAAPATPVAPIEQQVNPNTGMIWDALSAVTGAGAQAGADLKKAKDYNTSKNSAATDLWNFLKNRNYDKNSGSGTGYLYPDEVGGE